MSQDKELRVQLLRELTAELFFCVNGSFAKLHSINCETAVNGWKIYTDPGYAIESCAFFS